MQIGSGRRFFSSQKYASAAACAPGSSHLIVDYKWDTNTYVVYERGWDLSWVFVDEREVLSVDRTASEHGIFPSGWTGSRRVIPAGFALEPGWHRVTVRSTAEMVARNKRSKVPHPPLAAVEFVVDARTVVDVVVIPPKAGWRGNGSKDGQLLIQYRDIDDATIGRRPVWKGPASVDRNGQRIETPVKSEPWPRTGDGWC